MRIFLLWVGDRPTDSAAAIDTLLCDYMDERMREGYGKGCGQKLISGFVHYHPHLTHCIPWARKMLKGWERLLPKRSHPPLSWDFATVIACSLVQEGKKRMGAAVLLTHHCLLRANECCNLVREDIVDGADARLGIAHAGKMTIILRKTKTRSNVHVEVVDEHMASLVRQLVRCTRRGERLFPFTRATWLRHFKAQCKAFGLSDKFVLHSLRDGGATDWNVLKEHSLEDTILRGHWATASSARIYVQGFAALQAQFDAPKAMHKAAAVTVHAWPRFFAAFAW